MFEQKKANLKHQTEEKERRRKRKEAGIVDLPVPEPRLVLQKLDNESGLDWATLQWLSAYRNGPIHQFS